MEDKRDGDDAQSATSTGYHSQVREREGEETEREGGKKEIYFQSKSKSYSKSKSNKKSNPPGPNKVPSDVDTQNEIPRYSSFALVRMAEKK